MQFLSTNGGPHPADAWAAVTTNEILDLIKIDVASQSEAAVAGRLAKEDLRPKLLRFFTTHHQRVQDHERKKPRGHPHEVDPVPHINMSKDSFEALMAATPFAQAFARPEARQLLHRIIGQHSANVMHIERRYHADRQQKVA